ncbi:cAMP-regulated phosphoprotein family protein [Rhodotorula toruloides]|uniref:mRNA stability protein n=1 Tax=Rhodotorula toruloides TaxID=5286 RepID=A0A511KKU2_RHOTO|nr:cAMP-regulated phosphoprotein family protein [Rhodotorula toruloides]
MLPNRQKVDISSFSEQEKELFQKYGKVPAHKNLLANKLKERKYFDSGDYAMSKAGVSPPQSVGTAIPSPADIPHASPPSNQSGAQNIPGASTSPNSGGFQGGSGSPGSPGSGGVGVGVSPGTYGSPSKEPTSMHHPHRS